MGSVDDPLAELDGWWETACDEGAANTTFLACALRDGGCRLEFCTVDDADAQADWRLEIDDCLEFAWRGGRGGPAWFSDHALLAPYLDRRAWISIATPLPDPLRAWGAVAQAHGALARGTWRHIGEWIPLGRFLRGSMMDQPFGILAEGPERFMRAYEAALQAIGADVGMASSSDAPRGGQTPPSLLVWEASYFVARSFRLERTG